MTDFQAYIICSGLLGSAALECAYAYWQRKANIELNQGEVNKGNDALDRQTVAVLELAAQQKKRNEMDAEYVAEQRNAKR